MKRVLTAAVMILIVGLAIFAPWPWMVPVMTGIIALLAALEFRKFTELSGCAVPLWWTVAAVALFFWFTFKRPQDTITVVALMTLLLFVAAVVKTPVERVLWEVAAGVLMLVYIAYPLTLLSQILRGENGTALLIFLLLCVWTGDIAALYVGKRWGKHKLAPVLSPNKTVEGSIASIVGAVVIGMAMVLTGDWFELKGYAFTRLHTSEPWWAYVLLAIALNVAAQFGDLLESTLKRGVGVKDSGTLLPGHGGVLDRIDALLVAAPVLWFVLQVREYFSWGSL